MSTLPTISYETATGHLEEYVQGCVAAAADTTHGYKKREAVLRADGAIRLWIALYVGESAKLGSDGQKRIENDLVRLRTIVKNIPTDDEY